MAQFGTSFTISYTNQKHYHLRTYMACANQQSVSNRLYWGVKGQNGKGLCRPGTGKLYSYVCLCGSTHTSGCVVDVLGAKATH